MGPIAPITCFHPAVHPSNYFQKACNDLDFSNKFVALHRQWFCWDRTPLQGKNRIQIGDKSFTRGMGIDIANDSRGNRAAGPCPWNDDPDWILGVGIYVPASDITKEKVSTGVIQK
jgi:hypothetical protein